tara:strand:+ start:334 stop:540 length:207 start_codon:yes stop_codon:yes gene_type:complete
MYDADAEIFCSPCVEAAGACSLEVVADGFEEGASPLLQAVIKRHIQKETSVIIFIDFYLASNLTMKVH